MGSIKIDTEELEMIGQRFNELADRREEHNQRLEQILDKLTDIQSEGFVEEIVEKLEDHIKDVDDVQINNIRYSSEFLKNLAQNFTEVDEGLAKK